MTNVINLDSRKNKASQEDHETVLQAVEDNRANGVKILSSKLDNLADRKIINDPVTESAIRDLTAGLGGVLTSLEGINAVIDYIKHDLLACIQNVEQQGHGNFQASAHLQTLLAIMKSKGMITEKDMEDEWKRLMDNMNKLDVTSKNT